MATQQETFAQPARRPWMPAALAAVSGAVVVGLLGLLWFGLQQKEIAGSKVVNVPFTTAPEFSLGLFDGSTKDIPAYEVVDATVGYAFDAWNVQLNLRNILDKHYYINNYETLFYGNSVGTPFNAAVTVRRFF